ncbi:thiamine phosphate synthase [Anaerotalea alkaliphila]|uniref:Thiamine-phosphate synthase n=1 Tax=Anaerotalea alkaliphila TaxID=2662126 RepID=A0A7X5HVI6_9FIRM|nr:thiamine phosphate synthase [Anaerotalea alkaliphila]NDL67435.1 thiamine phosphate synthase [Anaerotalea alkaliphila]
MKSCKVSKEDMRLYVVTDRSWLGTGGRPDTLEAQVEEALAGGATFLQLREKGADRENFLDTARKLKALAAGHRIPFVVNDDLEVAKAADADGVHLGQGDASPEEARILLGSGKIVGVSAHTVEQALRAQEQGVDYIGVGAVFSTSTKADARPLPRTTLEAICRQVEIPVVAIGGIQAENILELEGAGIDGVAVVSAVFAQPDIRKAAGALRRLSETLVAGGRR